MQFLQSPPRFLFFTGKGGVGKTSIACAAAVQLAGENKRVLLVSTDPASNVGQVSVQKSATRSPRSRKSPVSLHWKSIPSRQLRHTATELSGR